MNPKDRIANNLVALGSAAVFTVYAAGFMRTREAAARFAMEGAERRRPLPVDAAVVQVPAVASAPVDDAALPSHPGVVTAPAPKAESAPKPATKTAALEKKPSTSEKPAAPKPDSAAIPTVTPTPPATVPTPAPVVTPVPATPTPVPARDSSTVVTPPKTVDSTAKATLKDGLFFGWGTSRHGDIQAGVEIKAGKITSAFISECLTQYSCSWIANLPGQVVTRQSAEVDYVSGATHSANAFYYAVVDALKKAK